MPAVRRARHPPRPRRVPLLPVGRRRRAEAGAETRAALVAFGVDASHGAERTHLDSIDAGARLLCAYLLSPLTFARWDLEPQGDLRDFPSNRQPAPTERFGELPEPADD